MPGWARIVRGCPSRADLLRKRLDKPSKRSGLYELSLFSLRWTTTQRIANLTLRHERFAVVRARRLRQIGWQVALDDNEEPGHVSLSLDRRPSDTEVEALAALFSATQLNRRPRGDEQVRKGLRKR